MLLALNLDAGKNYSFTRAGEAVGNWSPRALLVEMQNGAAPMEKSIEVLQKSGTTTYDLAIPCLGVAPKELNSGS